MNKKYQKPFSDVKTSANPQLGVFKQAVIAGMDRQSRNEKDLYERTGSRVHARDDKQGRKGFTLIELLVVVLIVGVLAAVALPQYKKAVFKSCALEGYVLFQSLSEAQELFRMENGHYSEDIEALSWKFPHGHAKNYDIAFCSVNGCGLRLDERNCQMYWEFNWNTVGQKAVKMCFFRENSPTADYARQVCLDAGGVYRYTSGSGSAYYTLPD